MTTFEACASRLAAVALLLWIGLGVMGSRTGANPATEAGPPAWTPVAAEAMQPPPEETPDETQPDATPPEETPDDIQPEGAADSGEKRINAASVAVAVAGFGVLLAIAAWWMFRHNDPDDESYPHPADDSEWPKDQMI
jgi:hypothetical protein